MLWLTAAGATLLSSGKIFAADADPGVPRFSVQ